VSPVWPPLPNEKLPCEKADAFYAEYVPHVKAADLHHVTTMNPAQVVGEDAVTGLREVGLNTDAEPAPEVADGNAGQAVVAIVEGLGKEAGGHGELAGGDQVHL